MYAIRVKRVEGKVKFFSVEHSIKWFMLEKEISKGIDKTNISSDVQRILEV